MQFCFSYEQQTVSLSLSNNEQVGELNQINSLNMQSKMVRSLVESRCLEQKSSSFWKVSSWQDLWMGSSIMHVHLSRMVQRYPWSSCNVLRGDWGELQVGAKN